MKKYRITKRFVDTDGNIFEPQELFYDADDYHAWYYSQSGGRYTMSIGVELAIRAKADWLEEVKEEKIEKFNYNRKNIVDKVLREKQAGILKEGIPVVFPTYTEEQIMKKLDEVIDEVNKLKEKK